MGPTARAVGQSGDGLLYQCLSGTLSSSIDVLSGTLSASSDIFP